MDSTISPAKLVGWHGKLPTVGDFATRRLDPSFVNVWDDWLSHGLAKFRAQDETHWVDDYLASPTWRFLLTPGFLPAPLQRQAWAGIVMPSMDRVGRYYPLTVAMPLDNLPVGNGEQAALWTWLRRIDDAAADALQEDWSIEAFESELTRIGTPARQIGSETLSMQDIAGHFFSASNGATRLGDSRGTCCWRSEAGLESAREFQSIARDESILALWRA